MYFIFVNVSLENQRIKENLKSIYVYLWCIFLSIFKLVAKLNIWFSLFYYIRKNKGLLDDKVISCCVLDYKDKSL